MSKSENDKKPEINVDLSRLENQLTVEETADTVYERKVKPCLDDITRMKAKNISNSKICEILDISTTTFYQLRKEHPEMLEAYKKGIDILVDEVESAAYKEAIGYTYEEESLDQKNGVAVPLEKYARPSTSMQKYILNNKRGKTYSTKQQVTTGSGNQLDLSALRSLSPMQFKQLMDKVLSENDSE